MHQIVTRYEVPSYVQDYIEFTKTSASAPHTSYALPAGSPRFPCYNKAATWLSNAYYLIQRDELNSEQKSKIEDYLSKYSHFWDIESDVNKIAETEASLIVKAANSYWGENSLEKQSNLSLRNPAEVAAAADWVVANAREIMAEDGLNNLCKMAQDILSHNEKCHTVKEETLVKLQKFAGRLGCENGKKVAAAILADKNATDKELQKDIADKVSEMAGEELQAWHIKLAEACQAINIGGDLPQLALAPDDVKTIKLANDAVIYPPSLSKLSQDDWMIVGHSELVIAGVPDVAALDKAAADRLVERLEKKGGEIAFKPPVSVGFSVLAD